MFKIIDMVQLDKNKYTMNMLIYTLSQPHQ